MVKLCVSDKPDAGLKVYVAFLLKVNAHRKGKGPNQTSKYLAQEAPRRVPSEDPFRSSSSRLGYLMDYLYGTRRIAMGSVGNPEPQCFKGSWSAIFFSCSFPVVFPLHSSYTSGLTTIHGRPQCRLPILTQPVLYY